MTEKAELMLITRNLPPLVGGMERLVWHIVDELSKDYAVHVIGPSGCSALLPDDCSANEVTVSPLWRFLVATLITSLTQAIRRRPRVVVAGSGLAAPFAWLASRLGGARCIVYLHGLDIESTHTLYQLIWHPFLRRFDKIIANSRFTYNTARDAGIPEEQMVVLNPGVSLPSISTAETSRNAFRQRYGFADAALMLYIGRITPRKGLDVFVEYVLPDVVDRCPTTRLVVIGDEPKLALNNSESIRRNIDKSLAARDLTSHVWFLGPLAHDDPEINEAYFAADVHVFPVQHRPGDNEGFGMVAVEAAAHGLPTVAYNAGGVADAIYQGRSGFLIPAGDHTAFSDAVIHALQCNGRLRESSRKCAEPLAWDMFGARLREFVHEFD